MWRLIYFVFPSVRDFLLKIGIIWHENDRQPYSIGFLKKGISPKGLENKLLSLGFERNIIAWVDPQEVISMRLIDEENPGNHFHIRLFEDGEVRGHYEKTAERYPIDHFLEKGMEESSNYIRTLIGDEFFESTFSVDFVSGNTISQSAPAMLRGLPTRG